MAQNPLDALAPVQSGDLSALDELAPAAALDAIAPPKKKKRGILDKALTPIPVLAEAGHQVANKIRGFEEPSPEIATEAPGALDLITGLFTAPLRGYADFAGALPEAVSAFTEQPAAAARGMAAGLTESLTQQSPVDLMMALFGAPKALRSAKSVGKGVAKGIGGAIERIKDPQTAAFKRAAGRATENVKSALPRTMSGTERTLLGVGEKVPEDNRAPSRMVNPETGRVLAKPQNVRGVMSSSPVDTIMQDKLRAALEEYKADTSPINRAEKLESGLPPAEDAPMPNLGSRQGPGATSPPIPDPGGMMGFAVDSGKRAVAAARRANRLTGERDAIAATLREERAARKAALDEAARQNLPESKAAPVSVVERSAEVANQIEEGLKQEGRVGRPVAEIPATDGATAAIEALKGAAPALRGAAPAAAAGEVVAKAGTATGTSMPAPTSSSPAAPSGPRVTTTMRGAVAPPPLPKGSAKTATNLNVVMEKIKGAKHVSEAIAIRDQYVKKAGATKSAEKAAAYTGVARLASQRVQQLAREGVMPAQAAPAATPAVPPVVQKLDMNGRPVTPKVEAPAAPRVEAASPSPRVATPEPAAASASSPAPAAPKGPQMASFRDWSGMTPEEFKALPREQAQRMFDDYQEYANQWQEAKPTPAQGETTPTTRTEPASATYDPDKPYESLQTDPSERAPISKDAPIPPGNQITTQPPPEVAQQIIDAARDAGSGPPPPGVDPMMHANMFALERQTAQAYKERGVLDPRAVDALRRYWGSTETANRLGITKQQVNDISTAPRKRRPLHQILAENDQRFKYLMDDPSGFMRNEAMLAMAGAAAGGLVGGMIEGEDIKDKLAWTIAGALIGGMGGYRAAKGPKAGGRIRTTVEQINELDTANLLAGPAVVKTSLGSMAGVAAGLWELVQTGKTRQARAALQYLHRQGAKDFYRMLTMPADQLPRVGLYTKAMAQKAGVKPGPIGKVANKVSSFVLRPFIAGDHVGTQALMRGGFSRAEAGRMMLVGEPTTWQGQALLKTLESNLFFRMFAKFPRVRIGSLERGIEYTPGLNKLVNLRHQKSSFGQPLKAQEKLSKAQLRARAQVGGTAMLIGTAYGYYMDPSLAHGGLVASAAGPAFLPAAAAITFGKSLRNKDVPASAQEALFNVTSQIPQIGEEDFRLTRIKQRLTPGAPLMRALQALGLMEE